MTLGRGKGSVGYSQRAYRDNEPAEHGSLVVTLQLVTPLQRPIGPPDTCICSRYVPRSQRGITPQRTRLLHLASLAFPHSTQSKVTNLWRASNRESAIQILRASLLAMSDVALGMEMRRDDTPVRGLN